jgi:hypothetical protein
MRSSALLLFSCVLALGSTGCGDDADGTDAGTVPRIDGSPQDTGGGGAANCPAESPNRDQMMAPCCYRRSNADQLDAPELRLTALSLTLPASLAIVNALLPSGFDRETLNWLVRGNVTGTTATITTGIGTRNEGDTFTFDSDAYPPVMLTGTIAGEVITSEPYGETLTVPLFDPTTRDLIVELPLRNLSLPGITLSENRSCIGIRPNPSRYNTDQGTLSAFLTVDDATGRVIDYATLDTTLCMLLASMAGPDFAGMDCDDIPRAMWAAKPDSFCDGATPEVCTMGECDPDTDCNAWQVQGGIAAHGIEITD